MIRLERLYGNLFSDKQISRQKLRKFTEDHLQRLAVQNENNLFTSTINDTLIAYNAFFGVLSNADTADAIQKSRTKSMQIIFTDFKTRVSDVENLVAYKLKKDSPAYQEFFPQGSVRIQQGQP